MRGHIEKRGKDTYRIKVYLGMVDGRKKYLTRTVHGEKKAAEKLLRDIIQQMETGGYVDPARITLGDILRRWLETDVQQLAHNTRATYRFEAEKHLIPALGAVYLSRLNSTMLEDYYQNKLAEGLSPATVRKHHFMLTAALDYAMRHRMIAHNVARQARPPRVPKSKPKAWTIEECLRFLRVAEGDRLFALWYLLLATGARIGELLALRWDDIDWAGSRLRFDETLVRASPEPIFGPTKTDGSSRTLWLMEHELQLLRRHKARQAEERLLLGAEYRDYNLVFATRHGTPLWVTNVRSKTYRRLVEAAGNPWIPLHGLRHTTATLLLTAGVHPKVVAERLGHSSPTVTLTTYSHVIPEMHRQASETLARMLTNPSDASMPPSWAFATGSAADSHGIPKTAEGRFG